jgi:hypothetical protein
LLLLSQQLYARCPQAFLISICGASFEVADSLSAPVAAALPEVIAAVRRLCN